MATYRLVLNSANRLKPDNPATIFDNEYFVDLPLLDDDCSYQFAVESFVCSADTPPPFVVEMSPLHERNSYDTKTKTTSCRLFQSAYQSFFIQVTSLTVGHYVPFRDFFRSKRLTIRFLELDALTTVLPADAFGDPGLVTPTWTMTLVIYPIPKK